MDRFARLPRSSPLGIEVPVATTLCARLLGLALLDRGSAPRGLMIPRCRGVHTLGMRFELDLVFLDGDGEVASVRLAVPPARFAACRRAAAVLELPAGASGRVVR
jgi:uncharacterized membrane protein (UPF0127 family)